MKLRGATIIVLAVGILAGAAATFPRWRPLIAPVWKVVPEMVFQVISDRLPPPMATGNNGGRSGDARIAGPTTGTSMATAEPARAADSKVHSAGGKAEAKELLDRSIAMLERCPSFVAKTRQSVHLYGKHVIGSGNYEEQRIDGVHKFRVELKMQIGNELRSSLQVCDGRYLWRCESYLQKGTAERIDLARVARVLETRSEELSPDNRQWWKRLGGLSHLLRGLRDYFEFSAITQTTLADQTLVIRLDGAWRQERLASLAFAESAVPKQGMPRDANLPEHIPDGIILFLGRDDYFPFRVEYYRRSSSFLPHDDATRPMVAMDLFEVSFDTPIPPSRFVFSPGSLEYADQTDRFLESLGVVKSR